MPLTKLQTVVLGIAGLTALLVGTFIALDPHAFYASYGIDLGSNVDLLSELRAPGTNLAALGGVMLFGLFKPSFRRTAVVASLIVFIAFSAGRILSLAMDGWPSGAIQLALAIELTLAAACILAFGRTKTRLGS